MTRTSSTRVYNEAVTIRDVLDHVPNTCELTVDGTEPPIGAEVKIGLGGVSTLAQLLFAGHVRQVRQVYEGQKAENVAWRVSCIDYTWLLNRRKVITQYPSQSATTTIIHLIANYTSGFTTTKVTAGLATLDPITFTNEEPADCLTRICKLLGAYWYVDYLKDVHVFLTESTDLPANITDANPQGAAAIESVEDSRQIRTRVYVEGGGAQAARDAVVGATVLYVDDPSWYNASGGTVVVGAQRVTYTGKSTAVITPGTSIAVAAWCPGCRGREWQRTARRYVSVQVHAAERRRRDDRIAGELSGRRPGECHRTHGARRVRVGHAREPLGHVSSTGSPSSRRSARRSSGRPRRT